MATSDTAIAVSEETRQRLYERKQIGDSYDDVLRRLLDRGDGSDGNRRIET